MDKITFMGIIVAVLLAVVVIQTVQLVGLNGRLTATGQSVATGGAVDTTGWTENEIMNYNMHGIVPARLQQGGAQQPASKGVGGCG